MSIRLFIRLGQSFLAAYCSGFVLTFLSMQILPWSDQQLITVAIFHLNLIGVMYLVTEAFHRKRTVVLHTGLN